jgi:hypothetical protein
MTMKLILIVTAATLMSVRAEADQTYTVVGQGTLSCGAWMTARQERSAFGIQQWVLGFLSGVAFMGAPKIAPLESTDGPGVWAWIDNYCHAHPVETVSGAATVFRYVHPR